MLCGWRIKMRRRKKSYLPTYFLSSLTEAHALSILAESKKEMMSQKATKT